jgi:acetylornithine deacetylase/succinyl-diaminopimelate desuccinylase-like protein
MDGTSVNSFNLLEVLKDLVEINSVYPKEKQVVEYVYNYLVKLGLKVKRVNVAPDRDCLIASSINLSKCKLGLYGHLDTVPPDKNYDCNPFNFLVEGDVAKGLGTFDMKGGVATILSVANLIKEKSLPVALIFGVDEELYSMGAYSLIESNLLNSIEFIITTESGQPNIEDAYSVIIGRKGRVSLNVDIATVGGHVAKHRAKINSIHIASLITTNIHNLELPIDSDLGSAIMLVDGIESIPTGLSVPKFCSLSVSCLTIPNFALNESMECIDSLIKHTLNTNNIEDCTYNVELKYRPVPFASPYKCDTNNSFFEKILKTIFIRDNITPKFSNSVADENIFARGLNIPIISLGPIGAGAHTKDEWVSVKSLNYVCKILKEIVQYY